mgnify:CR=1 FL=1
MEKLKKMLKKLKKLLLTEKLLKNYLKIEKLLKKLKKFRKKSEFPKIEKWGTSSSSFMVAKFKVK